VEVKPWPDLEEEIIPLDSANDTASLGRGALDDPTKAALERASSAALRGGNSLVTIMGESSELTETLLCGGSTLAAEDSVAGRVMAGLMGSASTRGVTLSWFRLRGGAGVPAMDMLKEAAGVASDAAAVHWSPEGFPGGWVVEVPSSAEALEVMHSAIQAPCVTSTRKAEPGSHDLVRIEMNGSSGSVTILRLAPTSSPEPGGGADGIPPWIWTLRAWLDAVELGSSRGDLDAVALTGSHEHPVIAALNPSLQQENVTTVILLASVVPSMAQRSHNPQGYDDLWSNAVASLRFGSRIRRALLALPSTHQHQHEQQHLQDEALSPTSLDDLIVSPPPPHTPTRYPPPQRWTPRSRPLDKPQSTGYAATLERQRQPRVSDRVSSPQKVSTPKSTSRPQARTPMFDHELDSSSVALESSRAGTSVAPGTARLAHLLSVEGSARAEAEARAQALEEEIFELRRQLERAESDAQGAAEAVSRRADLAGEQEAGFRAKIARMERLLKQRTSMVADLKRHNEVIQGSIQRLRADVERAAIAQQEADIELRKARTQTARERAKAHDLQRQLDRERSMRLAAEEQLRRLQASANIRSHEDAALAAEFDDVTQVFGTSRAHKGRYSSPSQARRAPRPRAMPPSLSPSSVRTHATADDPLVAALGLSAAIGPHDSLEDPLE
jgi:hypothetical protein